MFHPIALASVVGLTLATSASAMSFAPTIPTPANPHPVNPVATDGSPLPSRYTADWRTQSAGMPWVNGYADADMYGPAY